MTQLRTLLVEDSPDDAVLTVRELARGGYRVVHDRVQTERDLRAALERGGPWDLVVSDYSMPNFDALAAVRVVREYDANLPIIVVSGTVGEDIAVGVLKAGAMDFVVKGRLARFLPAVERELRDAATRREHAAAELALRESEQKYRTIVETAQEGIWQLDADGVTTFVNPRFAELAGRPADALVGQPAAELLAALGLPALPAAGTTTELQLRRSDGRAFRALFTLAPVRGDARGTLAMVTDVTELRNMQAQLLASDRLASVGMLAAGVAHEVNNPLAVVIARLELAREAVGRVADRSIGNALREHLDDATEAAHRVRQIARDLKMLARGDDDGEDSRHAVDVHAVLDSTLRMVENEIRHRGTLRKDYGEIAPVHANPSRLGQVFLNLLVNAAQALGEDRSNEVVIRTRQTGVDRVTVEIQDTGCGMAPEVLAQIFTPFFTTKPVGLGTGLGLPICHRIVDRLGGEITARSTVGVGTTFCVTLPSTTSVPRGATPPTAPVVPQPNAPRRRVLVVDDEYQIGTVLARILSAHDVTVLTRAADALELLRRARFDVVLCDLMMPDVSGIELYEAVRAELPDMAARFVFLTGGAFTPAARAFLDAVPNRRIEKPFDRNTIVQVVARGAA